MTENKILFPDIISLCQDDNLLNKNFSTLSSGNIRQSILISHGYYINIFSALRHLKQIGYSSKLDQSGFGYELLQSPNMIHIEI